MPNPCVVVLFRNDLRLRDHEGVFEALRSGLPILPCYIYDEGDLQRPLGSASKWWLYKSLNVLDEKLRRFGSRLIYYKNDTISALESLSGEYDIKSIIYGENYAVNSYRIEQQIKALCLRKNIESRTYNSAYLVRPDFIKTKDGGSYKVFTPYARSFMAQCVQLSKFVCELNYGAWPAPDKWPQSMSLDDLNLKPQRTKSGKDWTEGFCDFEPGEDGAALKLDQFLAHKLFDYKDGRDRPDLDRTSGLSPHMRFGEISPWRIWLEVEKRVAQSPALSECALKFKLELLWREFSNTLLFQCPKLHEVNFNSAFDNFPWANNEVDFRKWCKGETGYDLVDAGMKQLWQTGTMHNRVRMIAASFLTKHLMIDWRKGEQWFWDCLLDADPANNPASWQWVAGCGADAAPYFRIFNPISSADRFDPHGHYRSKYLGDDYLGGLFSKRPPMMISHEFARNRALEAYKAMRK